MNHLHSATTATTATTVRNVNKTSGGRDFETRLEQQRDMLYRHVLRLTHDPADAEDLVQETILRAYQRQETYLGSGHVPYRSSAAPVAAAAAPSAPKVTANPPRTKEENLLRGWLCTIQKNLFFTQYHRLRHRRDEVPLEETAYPVTNESPEDAVLHRATVQEVFRWLDRLPQDWREVVLLAGVDEASYEDIAARLAIPLGTVRSRLFRARARLERNVGGGLFATELRH